MPGPFQIRAMSHIGLVACCLTCAGIALLHGQAVAEKSQAAEKAPEDIAAKAAVAEPMTLLLRDDSVRKELRLTVEQAATLDEMLADVDYPLWCVRDLKDVETQTRCARAFDHLEQHLDDMFDPRQRARFDGIWLQAYGWPVVIVPRFAEDLKLSADKQARIRALIAPDDSKNSPSTGGTVAADKQQQVKSILTSAQQQQLSQRLGPRFNVAQIRNRPCRAPAFEQADEWINTTPLDWDKLQGKVVAVHFWAFGCINCVRNLPHYQSWHEKFADQGLVVIGLHTPETEGERVVESVRAKVTTNEMKYPIAIDGAGKNWNAWANRWWPSVYLVDKRGFVRYWWYGELNGEGARGEEFMRQKIETLLAEKD